jgi:hypothetical protein
MPSPTPLTQAASGRNVDFVSSDMAQLASHMERCAQSRGALFGLKRQLHRGTCALGGHIVTVAFVGLSLVAVAALLV